LVDDDWWRLHDDIFYYFDNTTTDVTAMTDAISQTLGFYAFLDWSIRNGQRRFAGECGAVARLRELEEVAIAWAAEIDALDPPSCCVGDWHRPLLRAIAACRARSVRRGRSY
jgi:hypothetical protein